MGALIHVTAWEKASPLRRALGAFGRVAILFALVLPLALIAYVNRYPIAARIWHWKHGYSATMGNYVIPVAEHWLILSQNSVASTMMNTAPSPFRRDGKFHTTAVVTLFPFRETSYDQRRIDFWTSLQRQRLVREGVKEVEEKTVTFGNEAVTCLGGRELGAIAPPIQTDIVSVDCMSQRGLEVMLVGEPSDLGSFYTFLSQIRRRR